MARGEPRLPEAGGRGVYHGGRSRNISGNRILNLLEKAEERVYLSCSCSCLESVEEELQKLVRAGRKLVLITDRPYQLEGALVYVTEDKGDQIGLITDSRYVLSGESDREA